MICGFKTKIRNSLSYIRVLLVIAIVVLLVVPVFAETYDTDTLTLSIEVSSYGAASDDCDGEITLLTPLIGGLRHNPKAQTDSPQGYHYAYETCNIEIIHNNPDTDFDVLYAKDVPLDFSEAGGKYTLDDIDNQTDCVVNTAGNIDEEKFGYRLTNVSLPTGVSVQEHDLCATSFDAEVPGSEEYMFRIPYIEENDLIIQKSGGSAVCLEGDCTFDVKVTANVAWETAPLTYAFFQGDPPPALDFFTTKVLVSEQP